MQPADPALARPPIAGLAGQAHPCLRCGAPVDVDEALCERCNPLGLPQPASSQAHGTIFLAIVLAVAAMAVVGRMAVSGVGPFSGSVAGVAAQPPGLSVTITVRNDGSRAASTTCRVFDAAETGIGPDSAYLLSPSVPAGQAVSFTGLVTTLGATPRTLGVDCR